MTNQLRGLKFGFFIPANERAIIIPFSMAAIQAVVLLHEQPGNVPVCIIRSRSRDGDVLLNIRINAVLHLLAAQVHDHLMSPGRAVWFKIDSTQHVELLELKFQRSNVNPESWAIADFQKNPFQDGSLRALMRYIRSERNADTSMHIKQWLGLLRKVTRPNPDSDAGQAQGSTKQARQTKQKLPDPDPQDSSSPSIKP